MPPRIISTAIVSENTLFRKVLGYYLASQEYIYVAAQYPSLTQLLSAIQASRSSIHVVLLDLCNTGTIQHHLQTWKQEMPDTRFVLLAGATDLASLHRLICGNVLACVGKSEDPAQVLAAIESASARKLYRNRLLTETILLEREEHIHKPIQEPMLDDRGEMLLQLLWEEKSNRQIADHLCLCESSVEKLKSDVRKKLGINSSVGLLKYAILNRMR
ncbi:LuxR C-terminal-related transcriptional regulator [Chitinophaga rhizophila]|uniref:LuxR C-terminal-related transcriptional regulator n=1 Tax=Chitinophaga rhizophila TaxID=2866212 RepID=A0ABS7G5X0_9BACT|nr:LuxR C-terminal-related transcriptional regulator [Chitinophaga rhizophila]MBW8683051.1 LuxR C-terminal-related transcriptional regulator [Chitinophaga rhizophila]